MSQTFSIGRPVALAATCALAGGLLLPTSAAFADTNGARTVPASGTGQSVSAGEQVNIEQKAESLGEELRFLFEEASSIDEQGNVSIDYAKIQERFGATNAPNMVFFVYAGYDKTYEEAVAALPANVSQSVPSTGGGNVMQPMNAYSDCVLEKSGFASLVSVFNGTLAGYIADSSWNKAGKLIFKAAVRNGLKVTIPGIVATLAASAVWCGFTA